MTAHQREHAMSAGRSRPTARLPGRAQTTAAVLVGGLAFALSLIAVYASGPTLTLKMESVLAPAQGFYAAELRDGAMFAWMGPHAELPIPGLDRAAEWHWTGLGNIWRPGGVAPPRVRIAVDGIVGTEHLMGHDAELIEVTLPSRPGKMGATLTFDVDPPFVPGDADSRQLGIAIESMSLTAGKSRLWPPREALLGGTVAILMLGTALAAMDLPAIWVLILTVTTAGCQTWLVTRGMAAYDRYPLYATALAFFIGLGAVITIRAIEQIRHERIGTSARGVAAFSALVCYLKLLILLHPDMPVGDGIFHAHRLEAVLSGHFYFTSLAPGNYAFPYPILLYLVAAPFSLLTSSTLDRVALLRVVVTAADAASGALLYWMVMRTTADRTAAIGAVIWYHIVPVTAWIMTWGNLTNAFGQTLFVASLAAIVAIPVEWTHPRTVALLAGLACAALLSHPSTCAILAMVLACTALLYWWYGGQILRGAARGVAVATVVAAGSAFVLYYAWFPAIYASELGRAAAESATRAVQPASSLSSKLALIPDLAGSLFGWPVLVAAAVGAWRLGRRAEPARLTLLLIGWLGTCLGFLVVGVLTPIDMRYHFAAFPALALTAALGGSWAWHGRLPLRIGAAIVLSGAAWVGVRQWASMLLM